MLTKSELLVALLLLVAVQSEEPVKDAYRMVGEKMYALCDKYVSLIDRNLGGCYVTYADTHGCCLAKVLVVSSSPTDKDGITLFNERLSELCSRPNGADTLEQMLRKGNEVCNVEPNAMLKLSHECIDFCNNGTDAGKNSTA